MDAEGGRGPRVGRPRRRYDGKRPIGGACVTGSAVGGSTSALTIPLHNTAWGFGRPSRGRPTPHPLNVVFSHFIASHQAGKHSIPVVRELYPV